ncbi:MAG: FmdB family transcriptional regulator [Opitutus sp.]|nr:FmdB family transcriptional regulator [Opitutus sp.]
MPIHEYYSPDTNRIYSFFAKTLAQGKLTPRCPDHPEARMVKLVSSFAIGSGAQAETSDAASAPASGAADSAENARMEAAMNAVEREFSRVDENDPRALARMMRRLAELGGEKPDGPMEEVVRRLEEGADPDSLEAQLSGQFGPTGEGEPWGDGPPAPETPREPAPGAPAARKFKVRRPPPTRDPMLYDYE